MMKLLILISAICMATACTTADSSKQETTADTATIPQQQVKQPTTIEDYFTPSGDSMIIPSFIINVELSESAEKKLRDAKETIIVSAILSGVPKDTKMKEYREWGEFALGHTEVEIPAPGTATFENAKILKSDYDLLASKDIQVLINVYSGRKSTENNLLNCEILQEPISKVRLQKNVLKGKLIGE